MKITYNDTQINFQGYKNIISGGMAGPAKKFMFLSAELNNNDGHSDLTEYQKFLKIIPSYKNETPNICCLVYSQSEGQEILFMNNGVMYGNQELRHLQRNTEEDFYRKIEGGMMKAHTLIASITRRISRDGFCEKDENITKVVRATIDNLSVLLNSEENAHKLFTSRMLVQQANEKWASSINGYIRRTMNAFFR